MSKLKRSSMATMSQHLRESGDERTNPVGSTPIRESATNQGGFGVNAPKFGIDAAQQSDQEVGTSVALKITAILRRFLPISSADPAKLALLKVLESVSSGQRKTDELATHSLLDDLENFGWSQTAGLR